MVAAFAVAALSSAPKTPVGTPALQRSRFRQAARLDAAGALVAQDSSLKSCGFSRLLPLLKCRKSEVRDLRYIYSA